MKNLVPILPLLMLSACSSAPASIELTEAAGGRARFMVGNETDEDIRSLRARLTYLSESGDTVQVDTFSIRNAPEMVDPVWLPAGEQTYFMQPMPEGSTTAEAELLVVEYVDGSAWGEAR